jgi:hypothetical protein
MRAVTVPLVRLLAGILSLLVGDLLFASTVWGSCGSHVLIVRGDRAEGNSDSHRALEGKLPLQPHPAVPCSGPRCSASEELPVPPAPPAPPLTDPCACLPGLPLLDPGKAVDWLALETLLSSPPLLSSIFHPPRSSV